jgi:drug/metabolite transporter (DMT)-like permease
MSSHRTSVFQALFVVFLWATSWVFIKVGLQNIPPLTFAGLRYTLAFLCLLIVLIVSHRKKALTAPPKRTWVRLLLLGILFYTGTQGASFVALSYLPAVTVNLLWSFSSITVAILGIALLSERPTKFQWLGIMLTTLGAFIYFCPVSLPKTQVIGVLVALFGVLANAGSSILGRDVNRSGDLPPLVVTVISMGIGSVALLTIGILVEGFPVIGVQDWAIIAWLAVVNTAFAFTLWNHTLRTLSAMESSIINSTMLIWIPILAILFLGERVTTREVIGLVAVGVGALIVQLRYPSMLSGMLHRVSNNR